MPETRFAAPRLLCVLRRALRDLHGENEHKRTAQCLWSSVCRR